MLQIGITGGIGSGKSLICQIFSILGVPVYDADSMAKYIMTTDSQLVNEIKTYFGDLAYDRKGKLNRAFIADQVFNNKTKLNKLNALVHPAVGRHYQNWVSIQRNNNNPYILKEAALMFDTEMYKVLNKVITVHAPINIRVERVKKRDNQRTEEQIRSIINNQIPEERRQELADYVIFNDNSEMVLTQVLRLHKLFIEMKE